MGAVMYLLKSRRGRAVLSLVTVALLPVSVLKCTSDSTPLLPPVDPAPAGFTDCITTLQIDRERGLYASNVHRFGVGADLSADPFVRYSARISDLPPDTLKGFCDWEACLRTNGYAHACWVDDARLEQCRVCDGDAGDTCDGFPMDQAACVAQAAVPGRASCHVGLLQDCLIQRAIRGFPDARVTETCRLSAQACAGELAGDLSEQAHAAKLETDQVTMESALCAVETRAAANQSQHPDAAAQFKAYWLGVLSGWDGGLPADALECAKDMLDAGADADADDANAGDTGASTDDASDG
jgi:hypothetical protein